jgi:hypothetical protein
MKIQPAVALRGKTREAVCVDSACHVSSFCVVFRLKTELLTNFAQIPFAAAQLRYLYITLLRNTVVPKTRTGTFFIRPAV